MTDFTKLQDLLEKPLHKYQLKNTVDAAQRCQLLQESIEDEFPQSIGQIKVHSLKNGTFKIITSPSLAQQIHMQRLIILQKFNEKKGDRNEEYDLRFVAE